MTHLTWILWSTKTSWSSWSSFDPMAMIIPTVIEKTKHGERAYDIYSRLLEDRIIFFWAQVTPETSNITVAQLLYLEKQDPDKDIIMYINSPGWVVSSWLAIYDTMQYVKCDIVTVCIGMAASMWAMLLTAWTKGKRYALPNAEVMIHQPLWWAEWQATDIAIAAEHILSLRAKLNNMLAHHTGQKVKTIEKDVERDNYMSAHEAKKYGLIDEVLGENNKK